MPRQHPSYQTDCPYHITARTNNQTWFQLPMTKVWEIFQDHLFFVHHAFGIRIHAFVLMSNHFHLLASDPEGKVSQALRWFMTETSREINRQLNTKNHVYGQRHNRTAIRNYHYYMHAYKYVYRNPIEAKVCSDVEEYPFSTLRGSLGFEKMIIPLSEDSLLGNDMEGTLKWLNRTPERENYEALKMAFRKSEFELRVDPKTRKLCQLSEEPY